jgi:NitT/TauT family transport system substrate-binding protein
MRTFQTAQWTRRAFLGGLTLTGTIGLLGLRPRLGAAEPPPEMTTLKIPHAPAACLAPQFVAEDLLRAEGFTDLWPVHQGPGRRRGRPLNHGRSRGGVEP